MAFRYCQRHKKPPILNEIFVIRRQSTLNLIPFQARVHEYQEHYRTENGSELCKL
jgi:hypothetical protein